MITAAIRALIPARFNHHHDEVRGSKPVLPYVVTAIGVPDEAHTSEGRTVTAGNVDVHLTFAGENGDSVRGLMSDVIPQFQGQRLTVGGYLFGVWVQSQRPRIYPTDVNLDGASRHLMVGTVAYRATLSKGA